MGWSKVDPASLFILLPIAVIPTTLTGFLVARTHRLCAEAATLVIILLWIATSIPPVHDWFWIAETASILGGALLGASNVIHRHKGELAEPARIETCGPQDLTSNVDARLL